jgi:hypothetical protein
MVYKDFFVRFIMFVLSPLYAWKESYGFYRKRGLRKGTRRWGE